MTGTIVNMIERTEGHSRSSRSNGKSTSIVFKLVIRVGFERAFGHGDGVAAYRTTGDGGRAELRSSGQNRRLRIAIDET